jgi:hypothetical protein
MDDADYTEEALQLIYLAAPERAAELKADVEELRPQFRIRRNVGGWLLDSGYSAINITDVTLQQLWVLSHGAWQAYRASLGILEPFQNELDEQNIERVDYGLAAQRVQESRELAQRIGEHPLGELPSLPSWLPQFDCYESEDIEQHAVRDSAKIARAFCFLHELEHIRLDKFGRDGLDAAEEEMQCDRAAIRHLLDAVHVYAHHEGVDSTTVVFKRALGIVTALYGVFVVTHFGEHRLIVSHPPPAERFAQLVAFLKNAIPADNALWVILHALLADCETYRKPTETRESLDLGNHDWRAQAIALVLKMMDIDVNQLRNTGLGSQPSEPEEATR